MIKPQILALATITLLASAAPAQQSILNPPPVPEAPPVGWTQVDPERRDGRFYIAAQPDIPGIRAFADLGGLMVVNLRRATENEAVPFDESDVVTAAGLRYLSIPVSPDSFSREDVRAFDQAVRAVEGPVLVHCASGNRAAAMIAARDAMIEGIPLGESLRKGYALGLAPGMGEAVRRIVQIDPVRIGDAIHEDRMREDVFTLAEFGTRHTLSDTQSEDRGIGAARRWVKMRFEESSATSGRTGDEVMLVELDEHIIEPDGRRIREPISVVNVICTIPGAMPEARDRLIYVMGHLDSRASDVMDAQIEAPGANDDASGVAACLELARILARERLDATVVLMATSGEEQGLYGATRRAQALAAQDAKVIAVLNNDMIGDPAGPDGLRADDAVRVFSEGLPAAMFESESGLRDLATIRRYATESDSPSRQLARFIAEVARTHNTAVQPKLIFRPDRFLRGGDHTPFNQLGFPAVRFTEVYEDYTRQHQDIREEDGVDYGDIPEMVEPEYLADVTRLNAAVLVSLANAPSPPPNARIIVAELTNDTTLRWDASPEPDVAGYQVVWRETTASDWQKLQDVGPALEATIDLSKDNWFFGLRAYDRDGYLSTVTTPIAARN